ncbi:hypothetical protein DWB63_05475 [Pseudodesulfovibrio sp. S3]|nr:hypothetical protein DWB63_05475 [Pseudodesulfovibrio sp. S3]
MSPFSFPAHVSRAAVFSILFDACFIFCNSSRTYSLVHHNRGYVFLSVADGICQRPFTVGRKNYNTNRTVGVLPSDTEIVSDSEV